MKVINSLLVVDAIGTLAVVACAAAGVWCGVAGASDTSKLIHDATAEVARLDEGLSRLQAALERQRDEIQLRESEFGARDLLPESAPVERELRTVASLAAGNSLELNGFTPTGSQSYPGVTELRYRMTAAGTFAEHLGFLRDFQAGASWADITYLKLSAANAQEPAGRSAEYTISLYAAVEAEAVETATE